MPTKRSSTYRSASRGKNAPEELSLSDMFETLSDALFKQAAEPNMHAYSPHQKQELFHANPANGRLYIGGNRSGKTVGGVIEDLWYVTRRHPYRRIPADTEIRGRVLGDGFDNGTINQVLIPAFKRWVIPSDLINGSWEDSWVEREKKLTLENGSFIEFKSYDQEIQKHAGTSRHFIHFDEEPPQNIYIENLLRIVDINGSWWMTMTPLNGMNWVYDELYIPAVEGRMPNVGVIEVSMLDNPYVKEEVVDSILQGIDEGERAQRVSGKFAAKGGLVFPEFGTAHILEGPDWDNWMPPPTWRVYMSIDHGINNPTAVLWHAVSPDNVVITFAEHYRRNMIVRQHAQVIKDFEKQHNLEVFLRPGDPAMKQRNGVTGTSIVEAFSEEGIYLSVDTIPRTVSTGIDRMRTYMRIGDNGKPHWMILKNGAPNLIKELKKLHWKTYSSSKLNDSQNRYDEVHKKDDHAFDSSRYFFTLMPDLKPDKLWHLDDATPKLKSYMEVLVEMAEQAELDMETPAKPPTHWQYTARGFSDAEYSFANLEGV